MIVRILSFILLYLNVWSTQQNSVASNNTYQVYRVPCRGQQHTNYMFPGDTESHLRIYSDQHSRSLLQSQCYAHLHVPDGKYVSIKSKPFEPAISCRDIGVLLKIYVRVPAIIVHPCDGHTTYHSTRSMVIILVEFADIKTPFSVIIAVRALDRPGRENLNLTHDTNLSGMITPYLFDGYTDYAQNMVAFARLKLPFGWSLMLSFPHFNLMPMPGCPWSVLTMSIGKQYRFFWRQCGNVQLPPNLHTYNQPYWFGFFTRSERGYTGFKLRFSIHSKSEKPENLSGGNAIKATFNCSAHFYITFRQHLMCNLETECIQAEDEASCPYWQGNCHQGFLQAGGRCYKYVRTRIRMTWYDASSLCLQQGLTLASFPTFLQGETFRDGLLRYAPTTFKTFIGLRTSDSLLPAIYREVWQWSSGIMAYYVDIDGQQLFKPTCGSFAALSREKISTTLCGFYEYMHYIFCEKEMTLWTNHSRTASLVPMENSSTFSHVNGTNFVTCLEGHMTHDFLSCDHESRCGAQPGSLSCNSYISRSNMTIKPTDIPMYVCDSQTQSVHYTLVCDHQAQCFDSSDESFCSYLLCPEKQCLNKQCVTAAQWCDGMAHCSDGTDEACPQFMTVSAKERSASTKGFHVVQFDGYGKYNYTPQGNDFPVCPPTHFMCTNRELCLPVYLRCNGVPDCSDQEDEDHCESVRCPGFYRCRQSTMCVHSDHVCDGVFQCPQQDDELLCELVCPDNCLCQGLAFVCSRPFPVQAYPDLRYLDSSGSGLSPDRFFCNHYLIRLSLSRCGLDILPNLHLPNLKFLCLDQNILTHINMSVFFSLSNLIFLSLSKNPTVQLVTADSNVRLENVHSLDLSYTRMNYFESEMLMNIRNLKSLNMSQCTLKVISDSGFRHLTHLETLDLRGVELKKYPVRMLQSLSYLRILFSNIYKLCCQDILPPQFTIQNCHTSQDEISSCKDLLRSNIFRMFLWISCCFALFGNAGSLAAKLYMQRKKMPTSFNVFVSNLNVADFFMGMYLSIVGFADHVYRGTYLWYDEKWKTSAGCKTAGFFSLLSCEMSAFIICLITLDRFLVIRFPFSQVRFHKTSALFICGLSWVICIGLAALPLLPFISHWEFYSQTDICIPLPVTKQDFSGHFYSFGILIVFNFLLFVLIAVGQVTIYLSIRTNTLETEHKNERESTVARRLLTIVMSDFLCWFPIGLFGLLASSGVSVPVEINVIMAVFALPLNSALDPFLYTFNLLMEKRRKASEERLMKRMQKIYADKDRLRQL